ncbi:MAG: ABC transporter permease [Christensenellaceae bacterium]|jgi:ribose transport system permease protein
MNNNNSRAQTLKKNPVINYILTNWGMLVGLIALCVIFTLTSENNNFASSTNIINILRQISMNAIIAFGMTMVLIIGGIDLSVGSVSALCGCTAVAVINGGLGLPMGILAALGIGALIGFANGFIIAKVKMPPFIVTLAMMQIARGFAYIYTDGKPTPISHEGFDAIGNGSIGVIPIPIILMIGALIITSLILNRTRFGRNIYAIGGNRECAHFSGVNVPATEVWVYVTNGLLTAVSGLILTSRMGSGQPMVGEGAEMDAIAAAVLGGASFSGGIGRIGGTIIGALVLGVLSNGLNLLQVGYYWQQVIKGAIILVAVYVDLIKKQK